MALRDLNLNGVHCWILNHNRVKKRQKKLYFDGISVHFVINWGESYENSERCLRLRLLMLTRVSSRISSVFH